MRIDPSRNLRREMRRDCKDFEVADMVEMRINEECSLALNPNEVLDQSLGARLKGSSRR